ncbi:MAG: VOC family protein [Inquilinaceae bacterium]
MEQRLTMVTLGVADLDRSRRFYIEGLGWRPSDVASDSVVFIDAGGVVLGLYGRDALAEDIGIDSAGRGFAGVALAHNVATPEAVAEVLDQAVTAGARLLKPAQDVFWGGHSGYFADPDGHVWEVAWNPFMPLDDQGRMTLPPPAA